MTPMECQNALKELVQNYGLSEEAATSKVALVYKACAKMEPTHFAAVCDELLREAGAYWPENKAFWDTFRILKEQRGWEKKDACPSCGGVGGHRAIGGVWLVKNGWRENPPIYAYDAFQDSSKPCAQDDSESAENWRKSYYSATSRGWTERTFPDYGAELRAWKATRNMGIEIREEA